MQLRIISRVITLNASEDKILLVRNKGANFWYAPGGGWEYEKEDLVGCAKREVKEETGLDVEIKKLLYLQEFHESAERINLEIFWLAKYGGKALEEGHVDLDANGQVEEARWVAKEELEDLVAYPEKLRDDFWRVKGDLLRSEDQFLGALYNKHV